jgi:hypothetical protein
VKALSTAIDKADEIPAQKKKTARYGEEKQKKVISIIQVEHRRQYEARKVHFHG